MKDEHCLIVLLPFDNITRFKRSSTP